ncbi:MAG: hypothetical protein IJ093_01160 [Bacilli bacterium]|nr:hypothetical protein [Bacilli bacterium]
MEQLSFFEKLGILWQNILAHPVFICILLLPIVLIIFNKKITKKAVVIVYIAILVLVLFVGNTTIFALFDNVIDAIFMALYFPNFITLFIVEILSAIITLITFLKKDITKSRKVINIIAFVIIQMLFCLILTVIQVNEIDIYEENALYSSKDVLTLMQLLMGTFALQIISLLVIYGIDKVTDYLDMRQRPQKHITHADNPSLQLVDKKEISIKQPEIKLPKQKSVKPLNNKLIEKVKLTPLDLNEEITKQQQKKKAAIPKTTVETLELPKEIIKKPLVPEEKPIEKQIIKTEKPTKPPLESKKPDLLKPEIIPVKEKPTWVPGPRPEVKKQPTPKFVNNDLTFTDFKPEYPGAESKTTSMTPNINESPNIETLIPKANEPIQKPVISDTKIEEKNTQLESNTKKEQKELITNLVIINFPKTVAAVRNLKTVYTL